MQTRIITREEVEEHCTYDSLWIIIHNEVYDLTEFVSVHPGGEDLLLEMAGIDATESFENVGHSMNARMLLNTFLIGQLPVCQHYTSTKNITQKLVCPNFVWPPTILLEIFYNFLDFIMTTRVQIEKDKRKREEGIIAPVVIVIAIIGFLMFFARSVCK